MSPPPARSPSRRDPATASSRCSVLSQQKQMRWGASGLEPRWIGRSIRGNSTTRHWQIGQRPTPGPGPAKWRRLSLAPPPALQVDGMHAPSCSCRRRASRAELSATRVAPSVPRWPPMAELRVLGDVGCSAIASTMAARGLDQVA
ncbi:hypothetical protein BS78_04G286700 [Paspalum vaginatum]|nr:hypothetical protein BS78_04G286700 [Paspalum vaginatum]